MGHRSARSTILNVSVPCSTQGQVDLRTVWFPTFSQNIVSFTVRRLAILSICKQWTPCSRWGRLFLSQRDGIRTAREGFIWMDWKRCTEIIDCHGSRTKHHGCSTAYYVCARETYAKPINVMVTWVNLALDRWHRRGGRRKVEIHTHWPMGGGAEGDVIEAAL